ncbi:radical SAM protein [Meridianimarinicoccus aquatilis]|uniref:Radical SAM core domain-containing protein n=1 Tax=Meridianimarinicoccus aquatilis TaxID=2552766 RepID=A0A4R6AU67_9RHOB|nr:radical SAM protein [Fluviibacterium aquatile]TDL85423.1 hypothetical protein E2L05_15660 [Fluviibacterium aquatile]
MLVKLATRCNLSCNYCYWFRDEDVYQKPPKLTEEAQHFWLTSLRRHILKYRLKSFKFLFHGGEPLLFGTSRFHTLMADLDGLSKDLDCFFHYSITTNAVLLDEDWLSIFRHYRVNITVSLDGPPQLNDHRRPDLKGQGSYTRTLNGIRLLQAAKMDFGLLAVADPSSSPRLVVDHFVDDLNVTSFDILIPDACHDDDPQPIGDYFVMLFDYLNQRQLGNASGRRLYKNIVRGLLGAPTATESIGFGPISTCTLLTDGAIEALDVVRITGTGSTRSTINVMTNEIQDITTDPLWLELLYASTHLPDKCGECCFSNSCGGGHISSRWNNLNRFDRESVYCESLIQLNHHIWDYLVCRLGIQEIIGVLDESN